MFEETIALGDFGLIPKDFLISGVVQRIDFAEALGYGMHSLYQCSWIYLGRDLVSPTERRAATSMLP